MGRVKKKLHSYMYKRDLWIWKSATPEGTIGLSHEIVVLRNHKQEHE